MRIRGIHSANAQVLKNSDTQDMRAQHMPQAVGRGRPDDNLWRRQHGGAGSGRAVTDAIRRCGIVQPGIAQRQGTTAVLGAR
jgi:hypothetical protein